jgi:hypothetical protein
MWCKSVGILRWLAPLLILRSVGFSVFFCRIVNVIRVSLGIGHNGFGLGEGGVLKAPHFTLALRYVKSTKVPNCYISPAFRQANVG